MTIKHEAIIRAVLDGKTVQCKHDHAGWMDYGPTSLTIHFIVGHLGDNEWRIKPETLVTWHPVYDDGNVGYSYNSRNTAITTNRLSHLLRLERDPETLEVLSCTKEQP